MKELGEPFKKDKNNLWYISDKDVDVESFTFNDIVKSYQGRTSFYHINGVSDYVIKDTTLYPLLFNTIKTKKLLKEFMDRQNLFDDIEFPVGYYQINNKLKGTIVPYYEDSLSIRKFIYLHKFIELKEYYNHDSDEVDNLITLFLNILELISKMYYKNIVYMDIHAGNFLFYNNEIKVIDFEYNYIHFTSNKLKYYDTLINSYASLVRTVLRRQDFGEVHFQSGEDFYETERKVKSLRKTLEINKALER